MANEIEEILDKLKESDVSVYKLSEKTGIPKSRIYSWTQGRAKPKHDDVQKLKLFFTEIPVEGQKEQSYTSKRRDHKNNHEKKDVPVRGGFTNLSNITVYREDPEQYEVIGSLPQNLFPGCDHVERAKGDSMYPIIMNQALLVGKRCSAKGIVMGEKYIIKTKEGLDTTKFIHPGSGEGMIKLKAHNKSIPDQEIELADIIFICRVTWIINPT